MRERVGRGMTHQREKEARVSIIDHTPDLTFVTDDHPEAGGRIPLPCEQAYSLYFKLDDSRVLCVAMGAQGYRTFQEFIRQMAVDDALDAALGEEA
jgi:hypothetical protein